jgi:hypothetical protein
MGRTASFHVYIHTFSIASRLAIRECLDGGCGSGPDRGDFVYRAVPAKNADAAGYLSCRQPGG